MSAAHGTPFVPRIGPTDLVVWLFWAAVAFALREHGGDARAAAGMLHVAGLAGLWAGAVALGYSRIPWLPHFARIGALVTMAAASYDVVGDVAKILGREPVHAALLAFDEALFGQSLPLVLETHAPHGLRAVLQVLYPTFLLWPLPAAFALLGARRLRELEEAVFAFALCFVLVWTGYILWPAATPDQFAARQGGEALAVLREPLFDGGLAHTIRVGLRLATTHHADAFPSGHAALAVCSLLVTWRYTPRLLPFVAPPLAGVLLAAALLRYHYGVDLVAGAFVGAAAAGLGPPFARRLVAGTADGLWPLRAGPLARLRAAQPAHERREQQEKHDGENLGRG